MADSLNVPTTDQNIKVVDEFLQTDLEVSANEYDFVYAFFKKHMKDPTAAYNATDVVFQVSSIANISVPDIINSLEGQTGMELTQSLAYFINGTRSPATMLGVLDPPKPNYYAARNVLI